MMFTLNAALRQDPRYRPSEWQGRKEIRKRSWHAIKQVAVAQTDGGARLPAFVRLGSTFGTAFLSNTWQPTRLADTQHAVVRGFVTLSADAGINAFQEFWPDIKTHLFRREPKTP
jgi:hypothetical protein